MKRNTMMRLASVLLVAVLLSTCTIAGTYAKYVSDYTPTSTARVAKWAFSIENEAASNSVTFDLFDSIKDTNDGEAETDIAEGTESEKLIAPGTAGSFNIDLVNESQVTARYKIGYTMENTSNIPIEFSLDPDAEDADWKTDINALYAPVENPVPQNTTINYSEFKTLEMIDDTIETPPVYWRWAIGDNDDANANDTTLGENGGATITITAHIYVEQVD